MIQQLNIENIILIERAEISLKNGFTVLTGETGAGKSAILTSLSLLAGKKADLSFLRKGASEASVEAFIEVSDPALREYLQGMGIEGDEPLILRRELSLEGKSRAYINNRGATLATLKELSSFLFKFVDQHASQVLGDLSFHREMVDLFGGMSLGEYRFAYHALKKMEEELHGLKSSEAERIRELEVCRRELDEIAAAEVVEGEDDLLFDEYSRLTTAQEWLELAHTVLGGLDNELPVLLQGIQTPFRDLAALDPDAVPLFEAYKEASIEMKEIAHALSKAMNRREINPERLGEVNSRLSLLHRLKKKYGDVKEYEQKTLARLEELENADFAIEELEHQVEETKKTLDALANKLSEQRKKAAKQLEAEVHGHLKELHMEGALFRIQVETGAKTATGQDTIEFMLTPNVGEKEVSVREKASGGELSRLMLILQTLLAGKEKIPIIIFDEIDANIGGQTATAVAKKLKRIGEAHQVFSVTHFPQVAKIADHHLRIAKKTEGNRTFTIVEQLGPQGQEKELERMLGIMSGVA